MYLAKEALSVRFLLCRGNKFHYLRLVLREICSVLHTQYIKNVLLRIICQCHSCNVLQYILKGDEVQAAVLKLCGRLVYPLHCCNVAHKAVGIILAFSLYNNLRRNV